VIVIGLCVGSVFGMGDRRLVERARVARSRAFAEGVSDAAYLAWERELNKRLDGGEYEALAADVVGTGSRTNLLFSSRSRRGAMPSAIRQALRAVVRQTRVGT
jgi:hypothetical protein